MQPVQEISEITLREAYYIGPNQRLPKTLVKFSSEPQRAVGFFYLFKIYRPENKRNSDSLTPVLLEKAEARMGSQTYTFNWSSDATFYAENEHS